MHKFITASYDASVYLQQPDQNAGRDEILEVGKLYYGSIKDIARTFIKFDIEDLGIPSGSWKAFLNLSSANSEELPLIYTIYANAVSQSWTMGIGTKFDSITTEGISWNYRDGITEWQPNTIGGSAIYEAGTTGSANAAGGTWYTAAEASQSFDNTVDDIRIDITDIVKLWSTGSIPNEGVVVHHSLENEADTFDYGVLKFFSKETNTIYEPRLELVWDDSIFITGSLLPVTGSLSDMNYKVVVTNLRNKYEANTVVKIRLKGRDTYPLKTFGTTFAYEQVKYLPTTTYYEIVDYRTGEVIIPSDEYSKVSCDSKSNYFKLDLGVLSKNRVYKLNIKVVEGDITSAVDDKLIFEIV